jgi:hypothetical protein
MISLASLTLFLFFACRASKIMEYEWSGVMHARTQYALMQTTQFSTHA